MAEGRSGTSSGLETGLHCLQHPASWACVGLLLLNDHLLRLYWPGWWTGKLGDFAWLFIFPFVLAAGIAWLAPSRLGRRDRAIFSLAFGLTGFVFSLAKTWQPFHAAVIAIASRLFGFPVGWRMDAGDLIALPSLLLVACLWFFAGRQTMERRPAVSRQAAWILLPVAALLTIANSIQPETGIICLDMVNDRVYARSSRAAYHSSNGGLTWIEGWGDRESNDLALRQCDYAVFFSSSEQPDRVFEVPDPLLPGVSYRIERGVSISRSTDGGQTWHREFDVHPDSQAERAYDAQRYQGNAVFFEGPLDALFEPASGNLVFAMGQSGVLVRLASGEYTWAQVGSHRQEELDLWQITALTYGEMALGLIYAALWMLIPQLQQRRSWLRWLVAGAAALPWLAVILFQPPAIASGPYTPSFTWVGLGISGLLLMPLVIEIIHQRFTRSSGEGIMLLLDLLAAAVLAWLPFLTWGVDLLPNYRLAQLFSLALAGGWIFAHVWHRQGTEKTPVSDGR